MGKTILTEVDGWTPLIDSLTKELGLVTSAVYGRVWRFCQGDQNVCCASLDAVAADIGVDRRTVIRHIKKLCNAGYLIDLTPDTTHVPHQYADTGKIRMYSRITVDNHQRSDRESLGSDRESLRGVTESHLKIQLRNKEDTNLTKHENVPDIPIENEDPKLGYQARIAEVRRSKTMEAMSKGHENHQGITTLFFDLFHVNVNWSTKRGRDFALWLKERPPDQTLRRFSDWWYSTDWRGQKGQPPSIEQVMTMWPQAFYEQEAHRAAINIPAEVY